MLSSTPQVWFSCAGLIETLQFANCTPDPAVKGLQKRNNCIADDLLRLLQKFSNMPEVFPFYSTYLHLRGSA
jgi:hypothetical protein